MFDEPVTLSLLKVWNYAKTPGRGVRDFHLCIDDVRFYIPPLPLPDDVRFYIPPLPLPPP